MVVVVVVVVEVVVVVVVLAVVGAAVVGAVVVVVVVGVVGIGVVGCTSNRRHSESKPLENVSGPERPNFGHFSSGIPCPKKFREKYVENFRLVA